MNPLRTLLVALVPFLAFVGVGLGLAWIALLGWSGR